MLCCGLEHVQGLVPRSPLLQKCSVCASTPPLIVGCDDEKCVATGVAALCTQFEGVGPGITKMKIHMTGGPKFNSLIGSQRNAHRNHALKTDSVMSIKPKVLSRHEGFVQGCHWIRCRIYFMDLGQQRRTSHRCRRVRAPCLGAQLAWGPGLRS